MQHILWRTKRIILLLFFVASHLHALVGPVLPGQSLWCITQRIGESTDTILDLVSSLLDCPCSSALASACADTAITVTSGPLTLTTAGNYCLATDFTGNIVINGLDITLDLNNRTVNGLISVTGDYLTIHNGSIIAPAPTGADMNPGINVNSTNGFVTISNCVINCSAVGASSGISGRDGIDITGTSTSITNGISVVGCEIISGSGTSSSGIAGNAGTGIAVFTVGNTQIVNNLIVCGNGGNNTGSTVSGNGSYGILLLNTAYTEIKNNIVTAGNGGSALGADGSTPGFGGIGIMVDANNFGVKIHYCTISGGDAGSGSSNNGGDGVQIVATAALTQVSNCVIAKTGFGSGSGTSGLAVNDLNCNSYTASTSSMCPVLGSIIYDNIAYNVANSQTSQIYKIHDTLSNPGFNAEVAGAAQQDMFHGNFYFL